MNNPQIIATDDEASAKHKYISKSGLATIVVLLATLIPLAISELCECSAEYPLRSISVLIWLISPFAAFIIWLVNHRLYSKAQDEYGSASLRIIWSVAIAVYLIYANKYAGDLVNELFKVDAGHFGISVAIFSLFYAPLEFYRSSIAKQMAAAYAPTALFSLGMVYGLSGLIILKAIIVKNKDKDKVIDREQIILITVCAIFIYFSMWSLFAAYFVQNIERSLKEFIVWADFSDNHRCNDDWLEGAKSVVFLNGSNVLALIEPPICKQLGREIFLVAGPCTYPSQKEAQVPFLIR